MLNELQKLVSEYEETVYGAWLSEFGWRSIPVEFRKLPMNVVGMYRFGKITLLESPDSFMIFDIYIHELRHVWQLEKHPIKYLIGKICRPLIELDADREEEKARTFIEGYKYETDNSKQ